jgi:hypothetical protein
MKYSIRIDGTLPSELINGKVMKMLRETASYDCHIARLSSLQSLLRDVPVKLVVFHDSCPALRLECSKGRVTRTVQCVPERKKGELAQDIRYEQRNRKNRRYGFCPGDLTSWIIKSPSDKPSNCSDVTITHRNGG